MISSAETAVRNSVNVSLAQKGPGFRERVKNYFGKHVRVGWAAAFRVGGAGGGVIDFGSARTGDATGNSTMTNHGNIVEFSEGRTYTEVGIAGFAWSAENTTTDNGATWNYGELQFENKWREVSNNNSLTIDLKIGIGIIYEDSFTIKPLF